MKDEDLTLLSTVVCGIAGMLHQKGVCTLREMADHFGNLAVVGKDYNPERAQQLAEIAFMLLASSTAQLEQQQASGKSN